MEHEKDIRRMRQLLGLRIGYMRVSRNLSQESFAVSIGMNRSYLAGVESGARNVSIDNLVRISRGLGVSLTTLVEGIDWRER